MRHPLEFIPFSNRKPLFLSLLALTLGLFAVFRTLNAPLLSDAAPAGVVSFELAGTPAAAQSILDSWDARAREFAAFGLGLDYLFMLAYGLSLALATLLAAGRHGGWMRPLGAAAGWGASAAALLDAIENAALWQVLQGEVTPAWTGTAALCASIKFALILFAFAFALLAGVWPKKTG